MRPRDDATCRRRRRARSRAVASSSSSSSAQPWTSPMMSNGPWSSRRLFQRRLPLDADVGDVVGDRRTWTWRKPSRSRLRSPRRICEIWLRTTCSPNWRSGRVGVALATHALRHVEHDGHGKHVILAGQLHQRLARLRLHVGGVDHGEQPALQPLAGDDVQQLERGSGHRLIVFVVGDQPSAVVRRERLEGPEMRARERALAAAGRADEHDERQLRNGDRPRRHATLSRAAFSVMSVNTAAWVGDPTVASTSPIGRKRTA